MLAVYRGVKPTKPAPTQTTTDALWRSWRDKGDAEARRELLGRYLGLVHHAAREVAPRVRDAVSLDELVSAGSVGLLQAMDGFDIDRGLAFSTFAMRRIRGAILDELRARDPLSRADRAHVRQLDSATAELEQKGGRAPTPTEVAQHLGVDDETVHRWRRRTAHAGYVSLETEANGRNLADQVGDETTTAADGNLELAERSGAIRAALQDLPVRERLVVSRSYFEERPLREIAEELGVTESRVCQLRAQALARLRRAPAMMYANE
ncbi:MAG TPA: FliA/WhiG family RNA polymerase sigma factor [Gemmatimonadales bacterium]|jgi:RNA polymerase sigma factor for flagellar operon FliA